MVYSGLATLRCLHPLLESSSLSLLILLVDSLIYYKIINNLNHLQVPCKTTLLVNMHLVTLMSVPCPVTLMDMPENPLLVTLMKAIESTLGDSSKC